MSNTLTFIGLLAVLVAVGHLAGLWWALLLLGLVLVLVGYVAHRAEELLPPPPPPRAAP